MSREYIIYADESVARGMYYSNFYGGLLVRSADLNRVVDTLTQEKEHLHFFGELKWQKVSSNYLEKYIGFTDALFNLIREDHIKIRIMFTQNRYKPIGLETYQKEHQYFLLYYQFIKHAFGLKYSNPTRKPLNLRIYFDHLPDTKEKAARFKSYIGSLEKSVELRREKIRIPNDQIAEVRSHDHILLQCIDLILGAIQFRLNNMHKVKPAGKKRRGKRTIAKEELYKQINRRIREIYPNFNIGINTGINGEKSNYWRHSYRHWLFIPAYYRKDSTIAK